LLAILERVDSKTLGVEELLALAAVLADGLVAMGNPAAQFDDDGQLERECDKWIGWTAQRVLPVVTVAALQVPPCLLGEYCDEE